MQAMHDNYEGCSKINVSVVLFVWAVLFCASRAMCAQNRLVSIEWSLKRNIGKNSAYNFTDYCTMYISL